MDSLFKEVPLKSLIEGKEDVSQHFSTPRK